jgi:hypothetical protein
MTRRPFSLRCGRALYRALEKHPHLEHVIVDIMVAFANRAVLLNLIKMRSATEDQK